MFININDHDNREVKFNKRNSKFKRKQKFEEKVPNSSPSTFTPKQQIQHDFYSFLVYAQFNF